MRISMTAVGVTAVLALAASAAQAQQTSPTNQMQKQPSQTQSQAQPDKDSQKFIKAAIEGNLAEIDVGKLAQEKGQSPAVKQFADMLVKDHSEANVKAQEVAGQLKVEPPTGSSIMQKATYTKLKLLSGATFDSSFANTMVSDHESDIKEYQKEAQKSDAAGKYAKAALPTLQKHLQEAQKLQKELETKTSGNPKPSTSGAK